MSNKNFMENFGKNGVLFTNDFFCCMIGLLKKYIYYGKIKNLF